MFDRRTVLLGLSAAATAGMPGAARAASAVIRGTVTYRERIRLPRNARLEVKLLDVSLMDAPSRTLAATTIRPRGNMPIPYVLRVDRSRILPRRTYALQARILVAGQLWFTTTTRHTVFGDGPDDTALVVERVATPR